MAIKMNMLKHENKLSKYATLDKDAIRLNKHNSNYDIRPNFFRDVDKIINCPAYTRYADKTQVFSFNNNDNISRRFIHVQLVSKIARTIGRSLNLNEDLIEAIALGHDIGHVPFGHAGEKILNELSLKYLGEYFYHNVQSVRNFMFIEKDGNGSNLTIQVLDGIMCHNGEKLYQKYEPKKKTKEEFLYEYYECYKDKEIANKFIPMTLEGCVVRISDVIGYIGRDIEDAIILGIINRDDIPKEVTDVFGNTNSSIIDTIVLDIIEKSYDKNYIMMSDKIYNSLDKLLKFNYSNIYNKSCTSDDLEKYRKIFNKLFLKYYDDVINNKSNSNIYNDFLNHMNDEYKNNNPYRIVIDFIAGMTDDYLMNEYKKNCD